VNISQINVGVIKMNKHLLSLLNGNDLAIIKKIPRLSIWIVLIRGTPFAIDAKDGKQYVSKVKHKKV
tara:strand:+ start:279 stop:479 length:201 start_codon:yes stop_codon:yes gene_type:complete